MNATILLRDVSFFANKTFVSTKRRQIAKFDRLKGNANTHRNQEEEMDRRRRWVVNLSSRMLTGPEEKLLCLGLNFAPTPWQIPYVEVVATVESAARNLDEMEATELKGSVCSILKRAKLPVHNLKKDEKVSLKSLKDCPDIVVLRVDKGNTTVVMDTKDYEQKISELLEDSVYKKLNKDPTATWERKVMNELKKLSDKSLIELGLRDRLRPTAYRPPKFYGLSKIHKPDVPLRPIVSYIGSPTYNLAKYVTRLISPLCGKTPSFVKTLTAFCRND